MHARILTGLSVRRFAFEGQDALYRDHLGRRVVADCEGSGKFLLVESEVALLCNSEAGELPMFPSCFLEFGTVLCNEPGRVEIIAVQGNCSEVPTQRIQTIGPARGVGLIAGCSEPVQIDNNHRWVQPGHLHHPVPFFRGFQTKGHAEVWIDETAQSKRLDRFEIGDPEALKARNWKVQNISKARTLDSTFEDGTQLSATLASHLNLASWNLDLPAGLAALRIRKTYDQFHGRQRARVFVDGEPVGWWYEPFENRIHRWAVADFHVPKRFLEHKDAIQISVDPPAGTPLWSVSSLEMTGIFLSKT